MAKTAQTLMSVHNRNLFAYYYVTKNGEEGEDRRHSRFAVNDKKWDIIDLESITEISHSGPALIGMSDDDNFMAPVY